MNSTSRMVSQNHFQVTFTDFVWSSRLGLTNLLLIFAVLMTAFMVIYLKDLNRRFFIQYQTLQAAHDKLYGEWGKLLLEQSTWSSQARVQKIAQQRLDMSVPSPDEIVMLKFNK
jgi:cell division protein FtsL